MIQDADMPHIPHVDLMNGPLWIIGNPRETSKIKTFLRAAGGAVVAESLEEQEDLEALSPAQLTKCAGVILVIPHEDDDKTVEFILNQYRISLVIISDSREMVHTMREAGCKTFLPTEDLNTNRLVDAFNSARDVASLQRKAYQLAQESQANARRFLDVADQFADWLWEVDTKLNFIFSSSRKRPAQGAEKGKPFTGCFLPEEAIRIEDDFATLIKTPKSFQDKDYWSFDAYGTRMCWAISGVPVFDDNEQLTGFRGVGKDISQEKSTADKLYHVANNDPVTGLCNRGRFFDELGRVVRMAERENRTGTMIVMNIDHFSYINETHGHETGDKLLIHVAQTLQDHLRSGEMLARVAGDEFAILLPDVAQDLEDRLTRVREAINSRPMPMPSGTLTFQMSMGVVRFPQHGKDADTLFSRAMQTLKNAKEKGRNRVEYHTESSRPNAKKAENLDWQDFITKCLNDEEDRIVLYYQPIVPLDKKGYSQFFEVLVRMIGPDGEIVVPTRFIEAAEDYGLVTKIDRLVATRSIKILQQWRQEGRDVHLSINLSAKTFDDAKFLDDISKLLKESGLPKNSLVFEITETSLLRDLNTVRTFMTKMKEAGAGFALDDCGVGYSSFNYIRHLDLDFIKIDGSFVRNLHISDEDDAFVQALHDVAKRKQIETVAEMVEHNETAKKLEKMGIEYGQGFFFSTPMPDIPDEEKN